MVLIKLPRQRAKIKKENPPDRPTPKLASDFTRERGPIFGFKISYLLRHEPDRLRRLPLVMPAVEERKEEKKNGRCLPPRSEWKIKNPLSSFCGAHPLALPLGKPFLVSRCAVYSTTTTMRMRRRSITSKCLPQLQTSIERHLRRTVTVHILAERLAPFEPVLHVMSGLLWDGRMIAGTCFKLQTKRHTNGQIHKIVFIPS